VLVVQVSDAPVPPRRRLRRAKPKDSDPESEAGRLPVSTLTAIRPEPLGDREAAGAWLESVRADDEAIKAELEDALTLINRALHAQRTSTLDAHLADLSPDRALVVRIGFGTGDELSDGRYTTAIDVPGPPGTGPAGRGPAAARPRRPRRGAFARGGAAAAGRVGGAAGGAAR
jgi:hypothetical protein